MKRIIVGRGSDCDIIIQDSTETISRHHLVISVNFFGKMTISDTSSNGTYVNGRKLTKGVSLPISRKDTVRLGEVANLDWNRISDPYSKTRKQTLVGLIILALLGVGCVVWRIADHNDAEKQRVEIFNGDPDENSGEWNKDSTENVAPSLKSIETGEKKPNMKKAVSTTGKRKKSTSKAINNNKSKSGSAKTPDSQSYNRINDTDKQVPQKKSSGMRSNDHSNEKDKY